MRTNATWVIWSATCLITSVPAVSSESLLAVMRSCAAQADGSARLQCYDRGVAQFKGADTVAENDTACSDTGLSQPAVSSKSPPAVSSKSSAAVGSKSSAATQVTPAPGANTDQFGLTTGQVLRKESNGERSPALKKMTARIVTLSHRPGGALVLHLDNGQVWEQTEDGPDLHIAAGDPVAIDRGILGAYWLSPVSGHLAVKVRRTE
jgi:hypothetical protein